LTYGRDFQIYYFYTRTLHFKVLHEIVIARFDVGKGRRPQSIIFPLKNTSFAGGWGGVGVVVFAPFKPEFILKAVKRKNMNFMEVF
jgi:hypothetical protein